MKFERVQQIRLHEQIVARFNEMSETGRLRPGDRLPPERELLVQFGVSRQVLREALTVMEAQGMVSTTPGGGRVFRGRTSVDIAAFVTTLKESALFEILDAREAIEAKAAELAAQHATSEEIEVLWARVHALKPGDYSFEWNFEYHLAIAEASHNGVLHQLLHLLLQTRREVQHDDYLTRAQLERTFRDHAEILSAISARDGAAAREAMRRHIATTRLEFLQRKDELARERLVEVSSI
jgi:GntR family transcriptional repressor for pyruvate dehydrogenase complex